MNGNRANVGHERGLRRSAYELQRAAGGVLRHASGGESVPALAITLAHVEEALDRLSVGMHQLARAVATSGDPETDLHERNLGPEARALCSHLRALTETLRASQDACQSSRMWTRRLLAEENRPGAEVEDGAATVMTSR